MKIKIVEMYLEDLDGKGTHMLTIVDEEGNEYQAEVEVYNSREDIKKFYKLAK